MLRKNLVLPEDLKARRRILEEELDSTIYALVTEDLENELKGILIKAGYTGKATLSWDFYSEYDDEGGFDQRARDLSLRVNDEYIDDLDEVTYMDSYKGEEYEAGLWDNLSDMMYQYNDDLYSQSIYDVTVDLG